MLPSRRTAVLIALCCGAWAASAVPSVAATWTTGPDLRSGQFGSAPDSTTDGQGVSTIVWDSKVTGPDSPSSVFVRRISRLGVPGTTQTIAGAIGPSLGSNADRTAITWSSWPGAETLLTARLTPSGTYEDAGSLTLSAEPQSWMPLAALPNGDTAAAWMGIESASTGRLTVSRILASGAPADDVPLGDVRFAVDAIPTVSAVGPDGHSWVAWVSPETETRDGIRVARFTPAGQLDGPVTTVSSAAHSTDPRLATARSGSNDAVLTWQETEADGQDLSLDPPILGSPRRGSPAPGRIARHHRVPTVLRRSTRPGLVLHADAQPTIGGSRLSQRRLMTARLPTTGAVTTTVETVASNLRATKIPTAVAVSPDATTTFAYSRFTPDPASGSLVIRRKPSGGGLQPEVPIASQSTDQRPDGNGSLPVYPVAPLLTASRAGAVLAVWSQMSVGGAYDTRVFRLESREIAADGTPVPETIVIPGIDAAVPALAPAAITLAKLTGSGDGQGLLSWLSRAPDDTVRHQTAIFDATELDVSASIPASAAVGAEVTFAVSTPTPDRISRVAWTLGNGNTASGMSVSTAYGRAGSYPVTATITEPSGRTSTLTGTVAVYDPSSEPPAVDPGGPPVGTGPLPVGPGPLLPGVNAGAVPTASPKLKIVKATRSARKIAVRGTIVRTATGRLTVVWTQKVGRKTTKRTAQATIKKGAFSATITLTGASARSRAVGKLTVRYPGQAGLRAATVSRSLKAPRKRYIRNSGR